MGQTINMIQNVTSLKCHAKSRAYYSQYLLNMHASMAWGLHVAAQEEDILFFFR